ncbi:MAG: NYN domain-containing protein, partial [Candidatus Dormibacteraceae bacterium]
MDKTAVFVDAGYLLAASAALLTGSSARSNITISHQGLVSSLIDLAECHSNLPLLRVYWYDGAKDAVPTQEHLVLARLPSVKLRLGRMTQHGQKGVDSLIVLDLVTLAQERAMTTAYLLSGDEDIREGVAAAQQMGVSVILLGVPAAGGRPNQADTLVREADDQIILDQNVVIDPHIRPIATQA